MEFRVLGKLEVRARRPRPSTSVRFGSGRCSPCCSPRRTRCSPPIGSSTSCGVTAGGVDKQNALWVYVSGLRKALEPDREKRTEGSILLTRAPGYLIQVGRGADRLAPLRADGRPRVGHSPTSTRRRRRSCSVSRWRCGGAEPFEDFTYESFAEAEIARLEELRLEAVELRVDADLRRGLVTRADLGVGVARSSASVEGALHRPADARAVPIVASGRRAAGVPVAQVTAGRGARHRAGVVASQARGADRHRGRGARDPIRARLCVARWRSPGRQCAGTSCASRSVTVASGTAYRAYQPAVGREVAIKVIRPDLANDPAFIRRFQAEAQVIATLEHPHIVPLYDYWREPDAAYLVMRLMRGGNLAAVLERGAAHLRADHDDGRSTGQRPPDRAPVRGRARRHQPRQRPARRRRQRLPVGLRHRGRRGRRRSSRSDIAGLGVLVAQALTGRTGEVDELRHALPDPVARVIDRAHRRRCQRDATRASTTWSSDLHEALAGDSRDRRLRCSSRRPPRSTTRTRGCARSTPSTRSTSSVASGSSNG